jgi:putative transposase
MPRRARLMLAGIPLHLVQRGNNRAACFLSDQDRSFYLFHLDRLLRPSGCTLHAYCLMTNHVHMLLTADSPDSCARLMKQIGQLHTQYVNRTYDRTGTLWEGRFRSCLVQSEDYVLACYRYIELNPVRAGLCTHPREHAWSSFGSNGEGRFDSRVTPHDEYLRLGQNKDERTQAYLELLQAQLSAARLEEIRQATNGNVALGREPFGRQIAAALGRRAMRGTAGRPAGNRAGRDAGQLDLLARKKNVVCP